MIHYKVVAPKLSNMACTTTIYNTKLSQYEKKEKRKYDTLDDAIWSAKRANLKSGAGGEKLVAYKCGTCQKYHIGRTGRKLDEKDIKHIQDELIKHQPKFKCVGKIAL